MVIRIFITALAFLTVQFARATITDTVDTQFTIQAAMVEGSPVFIFRAAEIENCPLRFIHHPGPIALEGQNLPGFELTIMQDETCRQRVYQAWGEAYNAMEKRGAVNRIYEQAHIEFDQAVDACNRLEAEFFRKYDGNLEAMNEEDKGQLDEACLIELPENVVSQRLMVEPEALAWRSAFKGPLDQTLALDELRSFYDERPAVPDNDIQGFLTADFPMRFIFQANSAGYESIRVVSLPITLSDLSSSENKILYNWFNPDLEVTSNE